MKDIFRYFIRKNIPFIGNMSNEEIDEIGVEFHNYLNTYLNDEQKKRVLPKSVFDLAMNINHPFKTNGFEPSYMLHFTLWIKNKSESKLEYNR